MKDRGGNNSHEIVQDGNPVLRATAKSVANADFGSKNLFGIIDAMNKSLEDEFDGVALAAPQIGVSLRIFIVSRKAFVIDENEKPKDTNKSSAAQKVPEKNMVCINPEIVKTSRKKVKVPEGCLSVRWYYGNTLRHAKVLLRAQDEHGKHFSYGGSGLISQIFQHETDHLNGTLFIDHATEIEELSDVEIAKLEAKNRDIHD